MRVAKCMRRMRRVVAALGPTQHRAEEHRPHCSGHKITGAETRPTSVCHRLCHRLLRYRHGTCSRDCLLQSSPCALSATCCMIACPAHEACPCDKGQVRAE